MIRQEQINTGALVLAHPEYDVYNTHELAKELEALCAACTIVDFANVRYIDSTCLGKLAGTAKRLRARGEIGQLTIINATPMVRRIFTVTGLDRVFNLA